MSGANFFFGSGASSAPPAPKLPPPTKRCISKKECECKICQRQRERQMIAASRGKKVPPSPSPYLCAGSPNLCASTPLAALGCTSNNDAPYAFLRLAGDPRPAVTIPTSSSTCLARPRSDQRPTLRQLAIEERDEFTENGSINNDASITTEAETKHQHRNASSINTKPQRQQGRNDLSWSESLKKHVNLVANIVYDNVGGVLGSPKNAAPPSSSTKESSGNISLNPASSFGTEDYPAEGFGRWREVGIPPIMSSLSMKSANDEASILVDDVAKITHRVGLSKRGVAARKRRQYARSRRGSICLEECIKYLCLFSVMILICLGVLRVLITRGILTPTSRISGKHPSPGQLQQHGETDGDGSVPGPKASVVPRTTTPTRLPTLPLQMDWMTKDRKDPPDDASSQNKHRDTFVPTSSPTSIPTTPSPEISVETRAEDSTPPPALTSPISTLSSALPAGGRAPTSQPSTHSPTEHPFSNPSSPIPTLLPPGTISEVPPATPSESHSLVKSGLASHMQSYLATEPPTEQHSATSNPSVVVSQQPSDAPSHGSTTTASNMPSVLPSEPPSNQHSEYPSMEASNLPSNSPSASPSTAPVTSNPTETPSFSALQVEPLSTCSSLTAESYYRESLLDEMDKEAYEYLNSLDFFNLSWRMKLAFGSSRNQGKETFGPDHTAVTIKAMRILLFWSMSKDEGADSSLPQFVKVMGTHASDIGRLIQLALAFVSIHGMTPAEGMDTARKVSRIVETLVPRGFDNPIFTMHAFAYDVSGQASLVIGDGMLEYLRNIPFSSAVPFDIALEAKLANVVGWHLQNTKFGLNALLPSDDIEDHKYLRRSLFSDVLGAYYAGHPKGGKLQGNDICTHYIEYARSTGSALCDTDAASTGLVPSEQIECAATWAFRWAWVDNAVASDDNTGVASIAELKDRFDARFERIMAVDRVGTCPQFSSIECTHFGK